MLKSLKLSGVNNTRPKVVQATIQSIPTPSTTTSSSTAVSSHAAMTKTPEDDNVVYITTIITVTPIPTPVNDTSEYEEYSSYNLAVHNKMHTCTGTHEKPWLKNPMQSI